MENIDLRQRELRVHHHCSFRRYQSIALLSVQNPNRNHWWKNTPLTELFLKLNISRRNDQRFTLIVEKHEMESSKIRTIELQIGNDLKQNYWYSLVNCSPTSSIAFWTCFITEFCVFLTLATITRVGRSTPKPWLELGSHFTEWCRYVFIRVTLKLKILKKRYPVRSEFPRIQSDRSIYSVCAFLRWHTGRCLRIIE